MMKTFDFRAVPMIKTIAPLTLVFAMVGCEPGDGGAAEAEAKAKTPATPAAVAETTASVEPAPVKTTPQVGPTKISKDALPERRKTLPAAPTGLTTAPTIASKAPATRPGTNEITAPLDITFDPPKLSLGIMQPGVPKTGIIKMTNNGDMPIQIKKAVASCGCTTPNWPKTPIAPGATADIEITLKPSTKQGLKLSKRVTLQMVSGAPQVLTVEGEVGLFVSMEPSFLDAGKQTEADQQSVTLLAVDKIPFTVISAEPDVLAGVGGEKGLSHDLTIDWEAWETGGRRPTVKLITDHPNAPELSVTVRRSIVRQKPMPPTSGAQPARPMGGRLVNSARAGDVDAVKLAIASGEAVGQASAGGMSSLHWAAKGGDMEILALLLDASADPNLPNKAGKTSVAMAAESGHLGALELLVEKGGDINHVDQIGGTPLLWAVALSESPATAKYLVDAGAMVNVVDKSGMTPLIWAASIGQPEAVAILVDNGAEIDVVEIHSKESAMMRAARIGKAGNLRILLDADADMELKNMMGQTAAVIAAAQGRLEKVKMLGDAGADLSVRDLRGWTVLDHARARTDGERTAVIEYLEGAVPDEVRNAKPVVGG
jgi:ankyrin repeat protein